MSDDAVKFDPKVIRTEAPVPPSAKAKPAAPRKGASEDPFAQTGEKRRVPRRPINNPVGVLYRGSYRLGQAFEIGEGGMLLATDFKLEKGDEVVVTLHIASLMSGVMIGRVVYEVPGDSLTKAKYGIAFETISFEMKRKIRNFVASATNYVVGRSHH